MGKGMADDGLTSTTVAIIMDQTNSHPLLPLVAFAMFRSREGRKERPLYLLSNDVRLVACLGLKGAVVGP